MLRGNARLVLNISETAGPGSDLLGPLVRWTPIADRNGAAESLSDGAALRRCAPDQAGTTRIWLCAWLPPVGVPQTVFDSEVIRPVVPLCVPRMPALI